MAEILKTDPIRWSLGPYHPALPGPMRLDLKLDGEIIVSGAVELGFLHKGLEKAVEQQSWLSSIPYTDHLDPENSIHGELAFCLAVEELSGIQVTSRAKSIRIILAELGRVCAHMGYMARVAHAAQSEATIHYVLRDRERILDLFELLTGSRFSLSFLRFGGVKADITDGFIERVLEFCEMLRARLKEYNDIFTYNHAFVSRTRGTARLSLDDAASLGITGPTARASGGEFDVRRACPYSGYDRLDFQVPRGPTSAGDIHDRFVVRLREISQSLEILRQVCEHVPPGEFTSAPADRLFSPPQGEAYSRIESARGLLGCYVVSDGGKSPVRVQFAPPSRALAAAIPRIVEGLPVEDLPLALASLDLGVAEVDR